MTKLRRLCVKSARAKLPKNRRRVLAVLASPSLTRGDQELLEGLQNMTNGGIFLPILPPLSSGFTLS